MVTALVTGGTGFLGSHVVRALLEAGHTVRVLRRQRSPLDLVKDLPVEHAIGDVMEVESLEQAMRGCQWVFHVAAASDYWRTSKTKLYLVNVQGTRNVLEMARKTGVQRVILTSSAAAVGLHDDDRPTNEQEPFNLPPQHFAYGHSKWLAEQEAWQAVKHGQDVLAVNPVAVFGPGDLNQISGSAVVEMSRGNLPIYPLGGMTVVDVRDVAKAHIAAAERGQAGERYLIGNEYLTHKRLTEIVAEVVHVPAPMIPVPRAVTPVFAVAVTGLRLAGVQLPINTDQLRLSSRSLFFDCHKAWAAFGKPAISIQQSIQDTYDWYVEKGIIQKK